MSTDQQSSGDDRRSIIDHAQEQQHSQDRYTLEDEIEDDIRTCLRALARGGRRHFEYIAHTLQESLIPSLRRYSEKRFADYGAELVGHDDWHWLALSRFLDNPDAYVRQFEQTNQPVTRSLSMQAGGFSDEASAARQTVEKALYSVTAIAETEDIIMDNYTGRVDATLFGTKVGAHLQDAEMHIGDSVEITTEKSGSVKTLFSGGTGQGKSAALETEAEGYYLLNHREGRDMKLIDLVGTGDGENWFYDIPQQQNALKRVRDDHELPETFEGTQYEDRDLEILLPLTPGLTEENLPFDTEEGEFTPRPFTIAASEIRKPLMVAMLTAKLTPQQESIIRDAYDEVDNRMNDWALADLAEEIKSRDELGADKKKPVIRTLRQLQNQGFIRTQESEYTLDWREVFEDTETITVFSQAFVDQKIAQLISIGYLIHTIAKKREDMPRLPKCALLMRELWTIAPHNQRQAFDARAAQLQEAIGQMLAEVFRVNRRRGIHILADTQQPSDLLKSVREMFNRYVIFRTDKDTVKDIFEWTSNDRWGRFYDTLTPKPGEASIVGMVEPAIQERRIEFVGPLQYSAPSHHHFDEDSDFTGWHSRVRYLDNEELRRPVDVEGVEWPDEVPTKLTIQGRESASSAPDPDIQPVAAFADDCLRYESHAAVQKDRLKAAFNEYVRDHDRDGWDFSDRSIQTKFGSRLKDAFEDDIGTTTKDGEKAYKHLTLNGLGEDYCGQAFEGLEDAASPIRAD